MNTAKNYLWLTFNNAIFLKKGSIVETFSTQKQLLYHVRISASSLLFQEGECLEIIRCTAVQVCVIQPK